MTISILGARVIDPVSGLDQVTDLHLDGGRIAAIGAAPAGFSASRTIEAGGRIAAPGLVDLGVSLREPPPEGPDLGVIPVSAAGRRPGPISSDQSGHGETRAQFPIRRRVWVPDSRFATSGMTPRTCLLGHMR